MFLGLFQRFPMSSQKLKIQYRGSLLWMIFWIIVFFPIALVLFFTGTNFIKNETTYHLHYDGSKFWLCFWTLVFFPIAFILLFYNGISVRGR